MRTFIPAAFHRGGTSKAVLFREQDLPRDRSLWKGIFLNVLGSPDSYRRQLDGLGGGLSSLSKVAVIARSECAGHDLEYTFFQVSVDQPVVDTGAMCGNMAASVGPFAVENGLVNPPDNGKIRLCIRNTNTNKVFEAEFEVADGQAVEIGDFSIPGVEGTGAPIALRFLDPAGSRTSGLLPTGRATDRLTVPSGEQFEANLVDATNPVVFVRANGLGLTGNETTEAIEGNRRVMVLLEDIRRAGSVAMGLSENPDTATLANPKVAMIAPPMPFQASNGSMYEAHEMDVTIRIISMGKVHRAVTLTGGMCLAAASRLPDFLLSPCQTSGDTIRVAHPAGVFPVSVDTDAAPSPRIKALTAYRTQRCLMKGAVPIPTQMPESDQ